MQTLFRPEAVEAQRTQWLGRVQLARPLSVTLLTVGAVAIAIAVGAFLSLSHYTRKATVGGVLVPDRGVIRLVPPEAGTVIERRVVQGQAVRAGDVLFVLAQERPQLLAESRAEVWRSLADRQRILQDAARQQQGLAAAQLAAIERRAQALEVELAQVATETGLQRQRLMLARQALERLEALRRDQFISDAQVQAKNEEVLGLQAQVHALERQRSSLQRERESLEGERRSLPLQAAGAKGGIERDLAALKREAAEQDAERRMVVRASQDGIVGAVLAEPGQAVTPASALASLVPQGATLQAHLYAPSSAIGFIGRGQAVRMRLEPFPYQRYGHLAGEVEQVSLTPLAAGELATQSLAGDARPGEPLFRITVRLVEGSASAMPQPLAAGMRLQADVLLERRRLVEWLFEPLLGAVARL